MSESQSYKNHTQYDPVFHFFLAPVGLGLLIVTIVLCVQNPNWVSGVKVLAALWAFIAVFKMRIYSLKVQDRVIRLEERVRLNGLLSDPVKSRIPSLTEDQLIGIRFASDAEAPELVEKALDNKWNRKQIKEAIKTWRPDTWRV